MELDWSWWGKAVWAIYIVIWAVIRFRPNRKSKQTQISFTNRSPVEQFSMAISTTGLGIVPAIWVFTGFPAALDFDASAVRIIIGTLILLFALWMFRRTHKALGKMWSHSLDLREGHKLVTSGVYERLRHPMYTAFWLWAVGQTLVLSNFAAAAAGVIGFGTLYFLRVGQEEAMMEAEFGEEYVAYKARTKRIIPGVY